MKNLVLIPPEELVKVTGLLEEYVKPAMESGNGETSYHSIVGKGLIGTVHFWACMDDGKLMGITTTEFIQYEGYKTLHGITVGLKDGSGFEDWHYGLEDIAREHGCRNVQFWGRLGWSRAIKKVVGKNQEKYKEIYRVFSMELDNESI